MLSLRSRRSSFTTDRSSSRALTVGCQVGDWGMARGSTGDAWSVWRRAHALLLQANTGRGGRVKGKCRLTICPCCRWLVCSAALCGLVVAGGRRGGGVQVYVWYEGNARMKAGLLGGMGAEFRTRVDWGKLRRGCPGGSSSSVCTSHARNTQTAGETRWLAYGGALQRFGGGREEAASTATIGTASRTCNE